ncbi:MBL fold metallo-hydrolase, partial [bacterium]|nr:MBL fold metallo-hydrolase [bacterium]
MRYRLILTVFFMSFVPQFLYGTDYIKVFYVLMANSTLGDCIFIQLPNGDNAIIDGGNISSTANANLYLDDFLDEIIGVGGTINHMILTHPDQDHSNGIKMAMDRYAVQNFYCTGQDEIDEMNSDNATRIANEGCAVYRISTFTATTSKQPYECYLSGPDTNYGPGWDTKVRVRVLSAYDTALPNPRSMVIKLSLGESTFYFGGDAEGAQEDSIMTNTPGENPIDIFKAEHHGSDTNGSNKAAFLDWMSPKFAFIPTGGKTVVNGPPAD